MEAGFTAEPERGARVAARAILQVDDLACGYGEATVLSRISFRLMPGRSLALLGRNGTGKTTLLNTLIGVARLAPARAGGRIVLHDREIQGQPAYERAAPEGGGGIGWVPQERNIFRSLTVAENLDAVARPGPWNTDQVYGLFPRLRERRTNLGNQLSGGEQQMLAIGRALVLNPAVLLLDEPLEGLAPILVEELLNAITRILRNRELAVIIVEQHPAMVLGITDEVIVLERGTIALHERSELIRDAPQKLERHLSVVRSG